MYLPPGRLEYWSESRAPTLGAPFFVASAFADATSAGVELALSSEPISTVYPLLPEGQSLLNAPPGVLLTSLEGPPEVVPPPPWTWITEGVAAVPLPELPPFPIRTPTASM